MPATSTCTITLATLRAFDPKGGRGSATNLRWRCPICGSAERDLSVNELEGVYHCWRGSCGARGRLGDVARFDEREMERRRREAEQIERERKRRLWSSVRLHGLRGTPGEEYLLGRGIPLEVAQRAGVAWCEWFLGHPAVVFRIRGRANRVVALQGRYLHTNEQGEKCRSICDVKAGVFPTHGAWNGDLVICEGPIDALSLACLGVPAIAACGTSLPPWLPEVARGKIVRLATDNDAPGRDGICAGDNIARAWASLLRPYAAQVTRVRPRSGKDWNEQLTNTGAKLCR